MPEFNPPRAVVMLDAFGRKPPSTGARFETKNHTPKNTTNLTRTDRRTKLRMKLNAETRMPYMCPSNYADRMMKAAITAQAARAAAAMTAAFCWARLQCSVMLIGKARPEMLGAADHVGH